MLCKCLQGSLQDSLCIGLWWYIMCRYTLSMFLTCSRVHSNIYKSLQGSLLNSPCIGLWWYIMCRYTLRTFLTCSRVHVLCNADSRFMMRFDPIRWTFQRLRYLPVQRHFAEMHLYLPSRGDIWPPVLPWSCVGRLWSLASAPRGRGRRSLLARPRQAP